MPDHWHSTTLGEACTLEIGRTPPRKDPSYWTSSMKRPFCTIADMSQRIISPSRQGVTELAEKDQKARRVRAGSLLMSFKLTIGRVAFAGCDLFPNEAIVSIVPDTEIVSSQYLYFNLGSRDLTSGSGQAVKGKTLNSKSLSAIALDLPPLVEQRRIVDLVESIDNYVDALEEQIDATRTARQGVLSELLSNPGDDWQSTTLGEIADVSWGNTSVTKKAYSDRGYTAYSASGPDGQVEWFEHDEPGVVLSAIGAQCGKTWLATGKWTPIKNTIWFKGNSAGLTEFLHVATCNPTVWPKRGQAQPFISLGDAKALQLLLPPMSEQQRIINLVGSFDEQISALETQIDAARATRSGVLSELLSGDRLLDESYDKAVGW